MSKTIHAPELSNIEEHSKTSATFVVRPLHTGYGMTLGNSLRRVLLTSVGGAAIVAFKIEGTTHEFTTVKGVKEDIVDIMLNLKGVRFKVYSEEPQTLRIVKKGSGPITAGDIELNADVEVVNKRHVIATIDDNKASFVMDLIVEVGRGYRAIEENTAKHVPSDMIALDSLFSPITRVRYKVSNTRVGQITDLDQLSLTIDTDGSITPKDAFEEANAILLSQYEALSGSTRIEAAAPLSEPEEVEDEMSELNTPIEDLNLSARTTNALINNDIKTIKELVTLSGAELRDLKGFGTKAMDEVKDKLAEMEL